MNNFTKTLPWAGTSLLLLSSDLNARDMQQPRHTREEAMSTPGREQMARSLAEFIAQLDEAEAGRLDP